MRWSDPTHYLLPVFDISPHRPLGSVGLIRNTGLLPSTNLAGSERAFATPIRPPRSRVPRLGHRRNAFAPCPPTTPGRAAARHPPLPHRWAYNCIPPTGPANI